MPELALVAECLATEGDNAALRYIDQLATVLSSDAEAIRAVLYGQQNKMKEATDALVRFFRVAHEDPWPNSELLRRSMARAETIASLDSSKNLASSLYEALRTPFAVWNGESDRQRTLLALGMHLEGNKFGNYTAAAIEAVEPDVIWERKFLETRNACYAAIHSPRAEQARRDLNEFMDAEAFTADISALTRVLKPRSSSESHGAYSIEVEGTRVRQ